MSTTAEVTDTEDGDDVNSTDPTAETGPTESDATAAAEPAGPVEETPVSDSAVTVAAPEGATTDKGRQISLSVRGLSLSVLIAALVAALGVMTWLYIGADRSHDAQTQQARDAQRAEQIALDYAVRAAIMDYKDLGPWRQALVEGTTPELGKKLTDAATAMEQILLPLHWESSAKPLAAKVRSHDNGVFVVDAFVSVMTKTIQAAENLQSTATYSVTINPADDWRISDVGGIGQVVGDN